MYSPRTIYFAFALSFLLIIPNISFAQEKTEPFLAPQLSVPIPGMEPFKDIPAAKEGEKLAIPWLAQYIAAGYKYFVGVAVILAIVLMMIGGFQWMTSGGNSEGVSAGKKRVTHAVLGLALALGSYTILYTINPNLVELSTLNINQINLPAGNSDSVPSDSGTNVPPTGKGKVANSTQAYIGIAIQNAKSPFAPCSKESAQWLADALVKAQVCVGPCHCAYTATNFLNYIGCGNPISGNAGPSVKALEEFGWISSLVNSYASKKDVPMGLLWTGGHDGVSLGNGKAFESAPSKSVQTYSGGTCPWFVGDAYNTNKCQQCEKIPGHGPSTPGKYAPNKYWKTEAEIKAAGGSVNTSECASNQAWVISPNYFKVVVHPPANGETQKRGCCKWGSNKSYLSETFCHIYAKSKDASATWDQNISEADCK